MTTVNKTTLAQTCSRFLAAQQGVKRYWVALSGGLDSCVLLHLLAEHRPAVPVHVIHVNHQLSTRANQWQSHCEALAAAYGFPFTAEKVTVAAAGRGLEMAARDARYAVFERVLAPGDLLLMAHHQNDQAETVLLRLLRGAGLRGLGAMPEQRSLGAGRAGRPLLEHTRSELQSYAESEGLAWVEDESNESVVYDRNFLRLQVLPQLAQRWPQFAQRFAHAARSLRESEQLLTEYASEDLTAAGCRPERLGQSISLADVAGLSRARRNAVLRHWIARCGYQPPERVHLEQVDQMLIAETDTQPQVGWGQCELRRFNTRLYLLPRLPSPAKTELSWYPPEPVTLPDSSRLWATHGAAGLRSGTDYRISFRQGGERCQPHNRSHSQKLKKLLQEYSLEPWLRDRVPLIYAGDQLAAVGDLWVCKAFYQEGEGALRVRWECEPQAPSLKLQAQDCTAEKD
jgi:tRNA(Ile)-lysidine synthase